MLASIECLNLTLTVLMAFQTKPFVKKFNESGLLDKLIIKGVQHQQTLDELRKGLVKKGGIFLAE